MALNTDIRKKSSWLTQTQINSLIGTEVNTIVGSNPGTVTTIQTGSGLAGGIINTTGTISLDARY